MYKLIPAQEKHLDQITALWATTGYWYKVREQNKLNVSAHELLRDYAVKPALPFTRVAVKKDDENAVVGVVVSASKAEIEAMPNDISYCDPKVREAFKNFLTFPEPEGYQIYILAVDKNYRRQGIGKMLFSYAEAEQEKRKFEILYLFVSHCQISAIKLYLNMGMIIMKSLALEESLPYPEILYLEKNKSLPNLTDYFDSEGYKKFSFFK